MPVRRVLLLGEPQLYEPSEPFAADECGGLEPLVTDLHDTLMHFRGIYGAGRAVAAPQIGVRKRLIYMCIDGESTTFLNPVLENQSEELFEVWDDCLCFPELLVKVLRHRSCRIRYRTPQWQEARMDLSGDLAELLQHECDHLDGILAVNRAIDGRSFALRRQRAEELRSPLSP